MESLTTIGGLFGSHDGKIEFLVPPYQRAYSWESESQIKQFLADLREQPEGRPYYMGHFLFEEVDRNNSFFVIDGQQRLTTTVIFFRALCDELDRRVKKGENILEDGQELEIWRLQEKYIKYKKRSKFRTVDYDNNFFDQSIICDNQPDPEPQTRSQERIRAAKEYIAAEMGKETTGNLIRWKRLVEDATVTTFPVHGKSLSAQVFSFQNDRGKNLTNLEKVKAFLIYQTYLHCDDEDPEPSIRFIEGEFSKIYERIERAAPIDEDQILSYYTTAFLSGWKKSPLETIKTALGGVDSRTDKEAWIKNLCSELRQAFDDIQSIQNLARKNGPVGDVLILDSPSSWPLLLKIYHHHRADPSACDVIFHLMEKVLFKYHYGTDGYRANYFPKVAGEYAGEIDALKARLELWSRSGFRDSWDFTGNFERALNGPNHFSTLTRYLLWKYENSLRRENFENPISHDDYCNKYGNHELDQTLDHIAPQNPSPRPTGYSEEFIAKYMHNIGNLVLMTRSKNSHENNRLPVEKAADYRASGLASQRRVGEIILRDGTWAESQIASRREEIINFAMERYKY